jgi:RNA polymerase sigma-70 factor (ECF subfamily)
LDREFELVRSILDGEHHKYAELIERYQRLVVHIVYRMVGSNIDREEICQEVFIKVFHNLESFNFNAKLSTWIAKIAHNHCINYLRKQKLELIEDVSQMENENDNGFSGASFSPEIASEQKDLAKIIRQEIEKLPQKYRTIITLYHLDEFSYKEIGRVLDLPEGTIKSYLFRARRMLKEKLQKEYQGDAVWQ